MIPYATEYGAEGCKALFHRLEGSRETFLSRARKNAELTLPHLMPPQDNSGEDDLVYPNTGFGATGVNSLASTMLMSLLPPGTPFFKHALTAASLRAIGADKEQKALVDSALVQRGEDIMSDIESSGMRSTLYEAIKHLIVCGNVALHVPKEGPARLYPMNRYVAQRDYEGRLLHVIVKETFAWASLPVDVRAQLVESGKAPEYADEEEASKPSTQKKYDIFTHMYLQDKKYHLYQSVEGLEILGSRGKYDMSAPPLLALRWTRIDGEDWGRAYVDEMYGDLLSHDGLSKANMDYAAAASLFFWRISPNSVLKYEDIVRVPSGGAVVANRDDLESLAFSKGNDLQVVQHAIDRFEQRIGRNFLSFTEVRRQGERVTQEEIRATVNELENNLGGVYTLLSQELQLPLLKRIEDRLMTTGKIAKIPGGDESLKPMIITGMEALGRGHDMSKLTQFVQTISASAPDAMNMLNPTEMLTRFATAIGIDPQGLIKTEEELAEEAAAQEQAMQDQQMASLTEKMAPQLAKGAMNQQ